jgi:hypothetical protein
MERLGSGKHPRASKKEKVETQPERGARESLSKDRPFIPFLARDGQWQQHIHFLSVLSCGDTQSERKSSSYSSQHSSSAAELMQSVRNRSGKARKQNCNMSLCLVQVPIKAGPAEDRDELVNLVYMCDDDKNAPSIYVVRRSTTDNSNPSQSVVRLSRDPAMRMRRSVVCFWRNWTVPHGGYVEHSMYLLRYTYLGEF